VQWNGEVEIDPDHYLARGSLVLPPTSCDVAVHAIPADVLGPLVGFGLAGNLSGHIDLDIDSRDISLERTRIDIVAEDQCTFVSAPPEADVTRFGGPFLHQALEPDGTLFEMETGPGSARWVPLYAMSPSIVDAVVAHEDAAYYRHHGFAPWAIRDAVVRNLTEGRYVVGASTITMQLAKNLFLRREKTLVRKIQEVILAWWLERALDKERILELYLNVIEYGPSVYGIGPASRWWFGRSAAALTPVEASILAIILPSPKLYAGMRGSGTLSPGMKQRVARFLRHMAAEHRLDAEALRYALEELETFRFGEHGQMNVHDGEEVEDTGGAFGGENYEPSEGWSSP
jgi:membrane peptidoglycan carboxypeptidase